MACIVQVACKKKASPANGNSVQPDNGKDTLVNMTTKINGADWQTDTAYGYKIKYNGDSIKTDLLVTATQTRRSPVSTITFILTNYTGPGLYQVNPPWVSATYYEGNNRHFAASGQISVESETEYGIIGTFNFIADSTNVTDGVFNVAQP